MFAKRGKTKTAQENQRLHNERPGQTVAIDPISPMPKTVKENRWVLVPIDRFTR